MDSIPTLECPFHHDLNLSDLGIPQNDNSHCFDMKYLLAIAAKALASAAGWFYAIDI